MTRRQSFISGSGNAALLIRSRSTSYRFTLRILMVPFSNAMLSSMETIYDVLRLLVAKGRPVLTDAEIALAHEIIDRHEAAAPVPDDAKAGAGSDAEAHA
jgi:hypothetical protein